jgi:hypothetical protein
MARAPRDAMNKKRPVLRPSTGRPLYLYQRAICLHPRSIGESKWTMRDITQPPPAIKITTQRMRCTGCGAETNAVCTCGLDYVPVAQRVADYDKEHPEGRSTRQAAADLGVSNETVRKARRANPLAPETVTGRDGKEYPARRDEAPAAPIPDTRPVVREHEANQKLAMQLVDIGYRELAAKFQSDKATIARLKYVAEEMRAVWKVDWF